MCRYTAQKKKKKTARQKEEDQLLLTDVYDVYWNSHISCNSSSASVRCPININGGQLLVTAQMDACSIRKATYSTLGSDARHSEIQRTGCHAHFP